MPEYNPNAPAFAVASHEQEDPDIKAKKEEEYNYKVLVVFVALLGIIFFIVPLLAAVADYWTDLQLYFYMDDTLNDFTSNAKDIKKAIKDPTSTNDLFICYPNNTNASLSELYDFQEFTLDRSSNTSSNNYINCTCGFVISNTFTSFQNTYCNQDNGAGSNYGNNFTTSNLDSECLNIATNYDNENNNDTEVICTYCSCGILDPRDKYSPQYNYAVEIYDIAKNNNKDKYLRQHCNPEQTHRRVMKKFYHDELETELTDLRNTNAAFLVLSAGFLIGYLVLAVMVLFRTFCSIMCSRCWQPDREAINMDEVTWLVLLLILLHLFEDLPQMIVSALFTTRVLDHDGSNCVENWKDQDFSTHVGPPRREEVHTYWDSIFWSSPIELFYITSFVHVFIHGVYGVSLAEFRFSKMLQNKWHVNLRFFIASIIMGFIAIWLMLVPYWYVIYDDAHFFGFRGDLEFVLGIVVLAGVIGWIGLVCLMLVSCLCCAGSENVGGDCDCC